MGAVLGMDKGLFCPPRGVQFAERTEASVSNRKRRLPGLIDQVRADGAGARRGARDSAQARRRLWGKWHLNGAAKGKSDSSTARR